MIKTAWILDKHKILTPEITKFLDGARMAEESRSGEIVDLIFCREDDPRVFNCRTWQFLEGSPKGSSGYRWIKLLKADGTRQHYAIHRMIARAFRSRDDQILLYDVRKPWDEKSVWVHHIDHNDKNDNAKNLLPMDPGIHAGIHLGDRELKIFVPDGLTLKPGFHCLNINGQNELIFIPDQERQQMIIMTRGESELVI